MLPLTLCFPHSPVDTFCATQRERERERDWLRAHMLELILAKVGSEEQLEKEAFKMAAGGELGCTLASPLVGRRRCRRG